MLNKIIPKLITVIEIFLELNEINLKSELPTFEGFLTSFQDQKIIKNAFLSELMNINSIKRPKMIQYFDERVPELGLRAELYLAEWLCKLARN